jgi:hypothetical protein
MGQAFHDWINNTFGDLLRPVFGEVDTLLGDVYMPWARICAVGLFAAAMIWVLTLRPEYVNVDAPRKAWYTDLRLWTAVAMLPHVVVYLFV